ncbi:arylsulfotransferase family protein [Holdemania filiformis]|uniref:arylsulfotransferase family protein n=1 Tax=Holdemania filiformis TaxID=61171 RepID=UPI00248D44DA|nr:arylsulfotransferase family protein [Holdemania filiformis]
MKWNRSDLLRLLPWGLLGLALIFFAALGFSSEEAAGCTVSISADGSHLGDLLTTSDLEIQINGLPLSLDLSQTAPIAAPLSLSRETANILTWTTSDRDLRLSWNGQKLTSPATIEVDQLSPQTTATLTIRKGDCRRNVTVQTLPDSFPAVQFTGHSLSEGDYYGDLMNDDGDSYIFKMDNDGQLLYYYRGFYNKSGSVMNFQKHEIDGVTYYSFFEPTANISDHLLYMGVQYGHINILDDQYQRIKQVELLPSNALPTGGMCENHEFLMLGENHYLITGSVDQNIWMSSERRYVRIKAALIQEIQDDEVIFEWCSSDYPALLKQSVENNDYTNTNDLYYAADYAHINSLCVDPNDGHVIASFRNLDEVLKIDRKTGEILWTLGGLGDDFGLTEEQLFSRQHYAKLTDAGTLLLFDNGNANEQTRILEFKLNEKSRSVTSFQEMIVAGKYSFATGSVMKTEADTYVIGWGTGSVHSLMSEIDFENREVIAEMIPAYGQYSYRVVKFK